MAIKWKNSLLLLLSVGLCLLGGYITSVSHMRSTWANGLNTFFSSDYMNAAYTDYLLQDEFNNDEAVVTVETIAAYRNRYGSLDVQVKDIKKQYQSKIDEAKIDKDTKKIKSLEEEKNKKIKAIVDNFSDDTIIKNKIKNEEEEYFIKEADRTQKAIEPLLKEMNENFVYYYKDQSGDLVITNLYGLTKYSSNKEVEDALDKSGVGDISDDEMSVSIQPFITKEADSIGLFRDNNQSMTGKSRVKKNSPYEKRWHTQKRDKERFQKLFWLGIGTIVLGIVSLCFYLKTTIVEKRLLSFMRVIPIDGRVILFLVSIFISVMLVDSNYPYNYGLMNTLQNLAVPGLLAGISLCISFMSLKLIWWQLSPKHRTQTGKELVKGSLCYQVLTAIGRIFVKSPMVIKLLFVLCLIGMNTLLIPLLLTSYGYLGPIKSLIILLFFVVEAWFLWKYSKVLKILIKKPTDILVKQGQKVNNELTLTELSKQLDEIDEMIQSSKKDSRQSEQLKTELLTNVSHDLRTPLTSIITYGELLNQPKTTTEDQKKYVKIINQKAKRMKHLIDDLFEVTKMNNGEIILEKSEVNLSQLLQQSVSEYSEELKEHELKLVFNKPETDIYAKIDGERMWRVFDNLLVNVTKYAMPNTRVYLKIEKQNKQARIELKNISEYELNENANDLVEKFKRGDSSRHTEGSGLGLAIVNSIVVLHNGQMNIDVDGDMFKIIIRVPL